MESGIAAPEDFAGPHYPHGWTDCKLPPRWDSQCDNDGLCCHDATDLFSCPWTRGEYGWAGEDRSIVSQFKRDKREPCLAHEVNYMEARDAWMDTWQQSERDRWAAQDPYEAAVKDKMAELEAKDA
jgi:hypothetical protein